MIRPAEQKDIPSIVGMLIAFKEEAGCYRDVETNEDSLRDFIEMMLASDVAGVALLELNGVIAGTCGVICSPHWFNMEHKQAQELWWYIKPEYRGRSRGSIQLFRFLEQWPKENGCKTLVVASTATLGVDKLGEFYEKRGFGRADVFYCKGVQ